MPRSSTPMVRVVPLQRGTPIATVTPLRAGSRVRNGDGATVLPLRPRTGVRDTIPKDVRALVGRRDRGLCVHCAMRAEHQHHRRLKGMGGSTDAHANCPCVIVSLCHFCHDWAHANPRDAMDEGLIIPRATPLPRLIPVAVHGYEDGGGMTAWPSCDGRWLDFGPDGNGAA